MAAVPACGSTATHGAQLETSGLEADAAAYRVVTWPEAARQFHSRGDWLGADSAYSVDLSGGRVLWLFGDSFIDSTRDGSRTNGPNVFIRNSIALQSSSDPTAGYDLGRADLGFHFRGDDGSVQPSSYFPEASDGSWIWPLHGARMPDGLLLLFRMQVAKVEGGLGFKVVGWDAVAIDDPAADPGSWKPRTIAPPKPADKLMGASVMLEGEYLYAYAVQNDDAQHSSYLARWPVRELAGLPDGALGDPEWFTERGTFERASSGASPALVLPDAQTEFSVHFDPQRKQFMQVQMQGLFMTDPKTQVGVRTAPRPEGPWSALEPVFRPQPPEAAGDPSKLVAYAAKAHPEQSGEGLVVTYVVNQLETLVPADAVYYPEVLVLEPIR